jgi:CRP/FNR family transcriptional regulator
MTELGKYFPFWDKLTPAQRESLTASAAARHFEKGALIHGGASDCVGFILLVSGRLRVYTLSDEGRELTLYRLFARDMCLFSASCVMRNIQFDVMVSAEEDSDVLIIPADTYKRLMDESAAVANYTNDLTASHFSDVMWLMDQILNKKLDSRLSAFLLEESELAGSSVLSITHEQIAGNLGTIREVVTRMLKYFQDEGLVKLGRGSITLLSPDRLEEMAKESLR